MEKEEEEEEEEEDVEIAIESQGENEWIVVSTASLSKNRVEYVRERLVQWWLYETNQLISWNMGYGIDQLDAGYDDDDRQTWLSLKRNDIAAYNKDMILLTLVVN